MPGSILKDVGQIIDQSLGLKGCGIGKEPHYHHKRTCQKLAASAPPTFDCKDLIEKMYEKVLSNWMERTAGSQSKKTGGLEHVYVLPRKTLIQKFNWNAR